MKRIFLSILMLLSAAATALAQNQSGATYFDPTAPIDYQHPLNTASNLNVGRLAWWLALPNLSGGSKIWDLNGLYPGTLTSMGNSSNGWLSGRFSPGAISQSLLFDGS